MPESPFAPYNPLLRPSRSTRGNQIALPQYGVNGTTFSTSDTTNYLYAFSGTIVTKASVRSALIVDANISLKHSAPPASVDVLVFLDSGVATGSGFYIVERDARYIASAALYTDVSLHNAIDLGIFGMSPGRHTIGVVVHLNTAGTLTMLDSSSAALNGLVNNLTTIEIGYTQP